MLGKAIISIKQKTFRKAINRKAINLVFKFFSKEDLKKFDKNLPRPIFYALHTFEMSDNEIALFDKTVKLSKFYLEFGLGGSTIRILLKSNAIVYSIDSSLQWIGELRDYRYIRFMEKRRLKMFHINIGKTGSWGYPLDNSYQKDFPKYSSFIFDVIENKKIDTVLIDGRFRVACALKTIMECNTNSDLQILIHDWHREDYHVLLNYFEEADCAGSLSLFKLKKNIDLGSVKNDYLNYKYDPR